MRHDEERMISERKKKIFHESVLLFTNKGPLV